MKSIDIHEALLDVIRPNGKRGCKGKFLGGVI